MSEVNGSVELKIDKPLPLPSDGWRSRKVWVGAGVLLLLVGLSFACLFVQAPGKEEAIATFDQVSSVWQVVVPSVLVPLFGALGWDKHNEAKARNGKG
jgi:hypothetical protein